ncbi:helix-turn-helix domain-containing protein [Paenibacillus sp. HJGM_3]|uniref:AraC family transcriptional regulator n=1 Tax=Paenibacillus sp. HJGM_3 TaxID=3379816 RepID=UPI00385F653F
MLPIEGRITEAMQIRFLHIKRYALTHTWRIADRTLEQAVFWLVEDGMLVLEADGGPPLECVAGDLLFLAPGTRLACHAKSATLGIVSLNFEAALPLPLGRGGRWPVALRFPLRCCRAADPAAAELAAVLRGLLADAAAADSAGKPLLLQAGLLRLLGLLAAGRAAGAAGAGIGTGADRTDPRVREAIALMAARPDALPTVRQLADAVRTSEPHLRKLFLRDTGLPPLQYLHRLKATMAMHRLAGSNERVAEIAYALGYEDANYFARMFKKAVGFPPQDYRRKHRDWMQGSPDE